jgi:hypothetical protein
MRIARGFQSRVNVQKQLSPGGAVEFSREFSVAPPGLVDFWDQNPQLKLRAIFDCPCGTKLMPLRKAKLPKERPNWPKSDLS